MERLNNINMESQNNNEAVNIDAIVSRAMADFKKDQNQDIVHETPTSKQSGKKIFGTLATAAAIGLGMTGCAEVQETPTTITEVQPSETKPSVTVTPTETSVKVDPVGTTEAPTATPTPEVKNVMEPTIEGYTNEVDTKTGLINLVNKETKEVDYIYNPNVWIGGEQVGGIAVKADKMKEILGNEVKIIMPFNINEITKETNFRLEDSISISLSEYLGQETHIMIAEFDGSLTFINPYIGNNEINTIDEFTNDEVLLKENGDMTTIETQVGLVPLACLDDNNDITEMTDIYYVMNSNNTSEVENFDQEKKYTVGEKTNIKATDILSFWCDYMGLKETTTTDVAKSTEGYVLFAYPEETSTTETNN